MKTEDITHIIEQMNAQISLKNLSGNKAAAQIGISGALLSNMRNGIHEKISNEAWRKVATWAGVESHEWKLRETANLNTITSLCQDAQQNQRFLAVTAKTGLGKTVSLKRYASTHENAYYVLCKVTMGRKDFLMAIQQALGIAIIGSIHQRLEAITDHLEKQGHTVLILDDVGKLNDGCLRLIQVVFDTLEHRFGMVIGGMPILKEYILKMAAKGKNGFSELKRRIAYWQELNEITMRWTQAVCADYGITEKQAVKLVFAIAKDYGTMRELLTNYSKANKEGMTEFDVVDSLHVGLTSKAA